MEKEPAKDLEQIKDLILNDEEYINHPVNQGERFRSYVFEVGDGEKKIVYFGSSHTTNPTDPLFEEIKQKFDEVKPDMVYIEGWEAINDNKEKAREGMKAKTLEEIKLEGEAHFALKLAVDAGTDFESPEPDFSKEIEYLLHQGFSKQDIFNFYVYRQIEQYQRENKERSLEDCKKYLRPYLDELNRESGWDEQELNNLEQDIFLDVDLESEKYRQQVDPIPWEGKSQTNLNEISRQSSNFRDRHMVERIATGLKEHNRLFAVYGSAHAIKQEPAVRALLD